MKGFYLSTEAILSLALLSALLIAQPPLQAPADAGLEELHVLQRENDLLKVWLMEASFDEKEMRHDFMFAFPGNSGKIAVDGVETVVGEEGKEGIASSLLFFDSEMQEHRIRLTVFD